MEGGVVDTATSDLTFENKAPKQANEMTASTVRATAMAIMVRQPVEQFFAAFTLGFSTVTVVLTMASEEA